MATLEPAQHPYGNRTYEIIKQAEQFIQEGKYGQAIDLYDLALTTNPDDPHLRYCVATLYSELYKSGIAISMLRSVVKDVPDHPQAWNNLGIAYKNSGQWEQAYEAYKKALELNYDAATLVNMSGLYINNGTPEEAVKWAEKGLKLAPGMHQLQNHRALGLLEQGKWDAFKFYDARFGLPGWSNRKYKGPMWKGENVKKLLIHGEQGLGDEILFLNALDRARLRAEEIILECTPRMLPTFERCFKLKCYPTKEAILEANETWDAWIPMGSLFGVVGFDEHKGAYLTAKDRYPRTDKFRIGVSFRGGTLQTHEHLRNFPVEQWMPLFEHDADFISLQYGPAAGMAKHMGLKHDQAGIDNIETLLSMIASCDLVITVCNTTVHMAGALGVPCWCLTPYKVAWRYGREGDKMPFYNSVRTIRQAKDEPWPSVINRVKVELGKIGIHVCSLVKVTENKTRSCMKAGQTTE